MDQDKAERTTVGLIIRRTLWGIGCTGFYLRFFVFSIQINNTLFQFSFVENKLRPMHNISSPAQLKHVKVCAAVMC